MTYANGNKESGPSLELESEPWVAYVKEYALSQ